MKVYYCSMCGEPWIEKFSGDLIPTCDCLDDSGWWPTPTGVIPITSKCKRK